MQKSYYGVVVWFIATLFVTYAFCLTTAAALFSTAIKASLHLSDFGVSFAVGAYIASYAGMQIPAGFLLDKFPIKNMVCIGIFLLALGNFCTSVADNLVLLTLANLLQGIGASFSFIASGIVTAQWFQIRQFPIFFGLTQTLASILAGVAHYYFIYILESMTWEVLYQYLSFFGFILFVLALIFVREPAGVKLSQKISLKKALTTVCKNGQVWLCTIAAATSSGILLAYASFWYLKVSDFYAIKLNDSLIISGLIFAGIGIGTPLLGWLSNKVQSRKLIIHLSLTLGNMALLLTLYLPHFDEGALAIIEITSFLTGLLLAGAMLFFTIVSEISNDVTRGIALGIVNTGVFLFNTLMMFIPYLFITRTSTMFFTFLWVFPFSIMIAIMVNYFIKESFLFGKE
jgi:MFS family permease